MIVDALELNMGDELVEPRRSFTDPDDEDEDMLSSVRNFKYIQYVANQTFYIFSLQILFYIVNWKYLFSLIQTILGSKLIVRKGRPTSRSPCVTIYDTRTRFTAEASWVQLRVQRHSWAVAQ